MYLLSEHINKYFKILYFGLYIPCNQMVSKGISVYIKAFIMDKQPYNNNPGS